jgi:hypothetical protein
VAHENQRRTGGKATRANFVGIGRGVMDSAAFITLSQLSRALYLDLRRQYNGRNNGDISIADSVLLPYGWSHSSIHKGVHELVKHGLLLRTRKGGIAAASSTKASLYAFCDLPVNANPAKGITGAPPNMGYHFFNPQGQAGLAKKSRVHVVTASVHTMHRTTEKQALAT